MVDQSLHAAADSLRPEVTLGKIGAGLGLHPPCAGPNDDRDTGRVMYELGYHLDGMQTGQQAAVYKQIKDYWKGNGYILVQDEPYEAPPGGWRLTAAQPDTDFAMNLQQTFGDDGILTLTAQSPCVEDTRSP
ncbi:MAG TPA: hypothetical protein VN408_33475 [Actinoplanes sp.]|nr:hypothetical protein [Actinoplanes sp.]